MRLRVNEVIKSPSKCVKHINNKNILVAFNSIDRILILRFDYINAKDAFDTNDPTVFAYDIINETK